MLTHLFKSINWVDAALVLLFVRMIFTGVKNGFISEFFKFLGVVVAVFVSLHYYSYFAAWAAWKTHISWDYWDLMVFAGLWFGVAFIFRFIREGLLVLFKVDTKHEGFDKYAAGIVAVARGILVCSMTIFLVLLMYNGPLTRMVLRSYSYKITGRAAVSTYSFLFNNLVNKLFEGQHYNAAAAQVLHPEGHWHKAWK
jgi:uncharacterized membrane protein required for colicin V production